VAAGVGLCRPERRTLSRRRYGAGSIYRRKSDGLWCAGIFTGSRQKYLYGRTLGEVKIKLAAAQAELNKGRLPARRAPTVAESLRSWLESSVKPRVRPLTYAGYRVNVEKHLIPILGKVPLDLLTTTHVPRNDE
jgi:integrase